MSDLCGCFPAVDGPDGLSVLAARAREGERAVPYVGDGSADTVISCAHGSWRLGDVLNPPKICADPACEETAEKNRNWCGVHKTPANRTEVTDVLEEDQEQREDGDGEGQQAGPEGEASPADDQTSHLSQPILQANPGVS